MPNVQADLNVRQEGNVCVVELRDRKILEELQIDQIAGRLSELVEAEPTPRLLLDFGHVEHLSSGALGVLITLNKQVAERQGQLVLAGIHPQIYEVFKITRLNRLFNIQTTTEEALKAFS
jgi:anti-sigma B factor antagonist